MLLTVIGLCISALSAIGGLTAILLLRGKWKIDKQTLLKLERERREADEARDRKRREEDESRDRERRRQDDDRVQSLRDELGILSRLSNQRFQQWRDAVSDLDELWEYIDSHMPWDNEAYAKLRQHGIQISRPPRLKPRVRKRYNVDDPDSGPIETEHDEDP